jgi:hypothetical protein
MLTEKAAQDRKWAGFPTLRLLLETKRIPDLYFGATSVSDNIFNKLNRLIEINILVEENRKEIIENLGQDSAVHLVEELYNLRGELLNMSQMIRAASDGIERIVRRET